MRLGTKYIQRALKKYTIYYDKVMILTNNSNYVICVRTTKKKKKTEQLFIIFIEIRTALKS